MMNRVFSVLGIVLVLMSINTSIQADDVFRVRLFFGLSLPQGGSVSLEQWQQFQNNEIAQVFEGFNVVDSVGYYQGKPERSKVVTVILQQSEMVKAKQLAALYSKTFNQDSVMLVKVPVLDWSFIGKDYQP